MNARAYPQSPGAVHGQSGFGHFRESVIAAYD